jgi:uncharacterized protein YerC
MKMSRLAVPALLAALAVAGCYAPQPTTVFRSGDLPKEHWFELAETEGRVKTLPDALQNALVQQRQEVAADLKQNGAISNATLKRVADLDEACNGAYLVSLASVTANPTPEMNGQFETFDDRRRNDALVYNANLRALADEWSRVWLMEMPGGTPYDNVNSTGRN